MPPLLDLFEIARNNVDALRARYERGPAAAEFWRVVDRDSTVSINLEMTKLQGFLDRGQYLNRHNLASADFDVHAGSRAAFENGFQDGSHFKYGALFLNGSVGATAPISLP